jgi:cellulose synthase/poly-beta-1,6-N-acetylglucosamine synthase-like glycosyltransferase
VAVHDLRVLVAATLAAAAVGSLVMLVWAWLDIPSLADVPPATTGPSVSIIVAARDEERHIRAAVHALLAQQYPAYDVFVVDDRSGDATGAILDDLTRADPRLHVVHVTKLPSGWLGKNHALHTAASRADGELLLFTDADVHFQPDALARAVRLLQAARADHLAIAVDIVSTTWPLALVVNYFMTWFLIALRGWRVRHPESSAFVGIGAFNLVRASTYRAAGGHARIPMRPDDDIMLGKLLKRSGARQLLARAARLIFVHWYHTLGEMARGLRKNSFAAVEYHVPGAMALVAANLAIGVWPFVAIWLTSGTERALYVVTSVALMIAYVGAAITQRARPWLALLYPAAAVIFVCIFTAAVTRTLRRGGIEWRGTFYSLRELRANRV